MLYISIFFGDTGFQTAARPFLAMYYLSASHMVSDGQDIIRNAS